MSFHLKLQFSRTYQEPTDNSKWGLTVIMLVTCFLLCSCYWKETTHISTLSHWNDSSVLLCKLPYCVGENTMVNREGNQHQRSCFLRNRVWRWILWTNGFSSPHSHLAVHLLTWIFQSQYVHTGLLIPLAHLSVPWFFPSQEMEKAAPGSGAFSPTTSFK